MDLENLGAFQDEIADCLPELKRELLGWRATGPASQVDLLIPSASIALPANPSAVDLLIPKLSISSQPSLSHGDDDEEPSANSTSAPTTATPFFHEDNVDLGLLSNFPPLRIPKPKTSSSMLDDDDEVDDFPPYEIVRPTLVKSTAPVRLFDDDDDDADLDWLK
eukprot:m.169723 g.169723  ORF g.169723 m.169723 type:complete len:164 (+) comp53232_c0_seq1:1051-1542(+)